MMYQKYVPEMANAEVNTVGAVTNNSQLLRGSVPAINSASEFSILNNSGNVNTEQYLTGRGLDDITAERDGENNNSPAQDAVYGRQRVGGTDIPLGVSATQKSRTIVSCASEKSNPLSKILRDAKNGRVDTGKAMQEIGGEELARAKAHRRENVLLDGLFGLLIWNFQLYITVGGIAFCTDVLFVAASAGAWLAA